MKKLYYDINEIAEMLHLEPYTLRYWEKEFPHLKPKRDARNRRRYTEADIEIIKKIQYQKEVQGRTIKGTREQLNHRETAENIIFNLQHLRNFLEELRSNLN
ncbi:MerR family transcriptional regulator [Ravibacter arvi]|uniref:MerR family transcriptional regulator n=1 Tax=Ravibacter arvi TaxID=2051041 RepID=A0ABP8M9B2_9BACT